MCVVCKTNSELNKTNSEAKKTNSELNKTNRTSAHFHQGNSYISKAVVVVGAMNAKLKQKLVEADAARDDIEYGRMELAQEQEELAVDQKQLADAHGRRVRGPGRSCGKTCPLRTNHGTPAHAAGTSIPPIPPRVISTTTTMAERYQVRFQNHFFASSAAHFFAAAAVATE